MKRLPKFLILGVVLLSLQSCFVAKNYERPQVVNQAYFRTDSIVKDSATIATLSWKQLFTDPVLQQYIQKGLENNIDIRVALQQILEAQAYLKQGKAAYFPTLQGNASVTRSYFSKNGQQGRGFSGTGTNNVPTSGSIDHFDLYQVGANLSWEADIWGKIRSNEQAYNASYLQTVAAHKAVKTQLIADIASTYYQLLSLDEQIRVTKKTIKTRQDGLETTKALKQAGNVTAVAVKQTEAQVYTAQGILIDLKNQLHRLENTLSILLGSAPQEKERTSLEDQQISTNLSTGVPAQLLRNRPDVMAAEYRLINAFELTNVARADFYPSITLSASGGLQSLDIDKLFSANSLFATLVGGLTQPIFNGRKIRSRYEVSQAQQEEARLDFRQAILNASKEVSDALYSYKSATEKITVKEKEFNAYNTATNYSEQLLDNGLANFLEVLTSRERALNSRLDLINAKYNQLNSMVNLYQALGGGWQ